MITKGDDVCIPGYYACSEACKLIDDLLKSYKQYLTSRSPDDKVAYEAARKRLLDHKETCGAR